MGRYAVSSDGIRIHYQVTGAGSTALVFVHGWLGNAEWWNAQRDHFASRFVVVQIDLAGRGGSDRRSTWSVGHYADDIKAVVDQLEARDVVLVGHSMSGAWVVEAAPSIARTKAVVLIDTLKDLDQLPTGEQAQQLFALYRSDFRSAVENVLPKFLFSEHTPPQIRSRLQREFLETDPDLAVHMIEPLYQMDVREAARRVTVPVRAINSDLTPTNRETNLRYFRDFEYVTITGTGHYPMLERPDELDRLLDGVLAQLGVS